MFLLSVLRLILWFACICEFSFIVKMRVVIFGTMTVHGVDFNEDFRSLAWP